MREKIPCGLRRAGGLRRKRAAGLTLTELLLVIAIVTILAAIILTSLSHSKIHPARPQTSTICFKFPVAPPLRDMAQNKENDLSLS
jgi:prepilin-type N-terminal cleavage/methylation domain-containing protein